jgi:hypothetical protein
MCRVVSRLYFPTLKEDISEKIAFGFFPATPLYSSWVRTTKQLLKHFSMELRHLRYFVRVAEAENVSPCRTEASHIPTGSEPADSRP